MKAKRLLLTIIGVLIVIVFGIFIWLERLDQNIIPKAFDGVQALTTVQDLVNLGPRVPDSQAHLKAIEYIQANLLKFGWGSVVLEQSINGHTAKNILATRNNPNPVILLGAHYDSRIFADNDPIISNRILPVPGANDGASGVAVLLELAHTLPIDSVPTALLFIDLEDNGRIPGWDWIQGSRAFAKQITFQPKAVVILDMIGDSNLNIYKEKYSNPEITDQIWNTARDLGYSDTFIPEYKYSILDDHIPFLEKNFPAVDIIDLDYQYWHTTQDLPEKVSSTSLKIIGETILAWIHQFGNCLKLNNCPSH